MTYTAGLRGRMVAIILAALVAGLTIVTTTSPVPATAASKCTTLDKNVHLLFHSSYGVGALTYDSSRIASFKKAGYADLGVLFKASAKASGLSAVHEMYNAKSRDRIYTKSATEMAGIKKKGYVDQGIAFYAYASSGSCLYPVYRFHKGPAHLFVGTTTDRAALKAQGWTEQSVVYWLSKPASLIKSTVPKPTANAFTIAVIPDTQNETGGAGDIRFPDRINWLVKSRSKLNLQFVTHVGDVVNWDTPTHDMYSRARSAMQILNRNNIPYSISPGNHDTAAVCAGGSACAGQSASVAVRNTTTFNAYLNGGVADVRGYYEQNKVDNTYSTFSAGGRKWLVLNLELWPRKGVITWAQSVVASHSDYNVAIVTHSYLTASGAIYNRADYGSTSPQYLYDNLVSRYANVRLVFSGHVGTGAHRIDHGVHGNRIDSFLLCIHSANNTNPVRLVQIDPSNGLLKTWVYSSVKPTYNYASFSYASGGLGW